MKTKLLTICLLLFTSQVFASESSFKSDLFKGSNLVSHCHNMKATWGMPLKHHYPYEMNRVISPPLSLKKKKMPPFESRPRSRASTGAPRAWGTPRDAIEVSRS